MPTDRTEQMEQRNEIKIKIALHLKIEKKITLRTHDDALA